MDDLQLDYFYGNEAEQFCFYRIPKMLFTDKRFSILSIEAKVLYGLLLDRMGLSVKNGWIDKENHVYIYFTLEDAMELVNVGKDKGVRLFAELDVDKGCGLIKRKRQGLGKPTIIYVMNFTSVNKNETIMDSDTDDVENGLAGQSSEDSNIKGTNDVEIKTSEIPNSGLLYSAEVLTSEKSKSGFLEKPDSRLLENRTLDFGKAEANNTNINNNKNNNTDFSDTYLIQSYPQKSENESDAMNTRKKYRKLICDNIEYEILISRNANDVVEGIVEIMLDAVCSSRDTLVVNCSDVPQAIVQSRLLKLDFSHIEYVIECLNNNTNKVHNIKSYMLTALYNSYSTIGHYYTAEVNHDLYGIKKGES